MWQEIAHFVGGVLFLGTPAYVSALLFVTARIIARLTHVR